MRILLRVLPCVSLAIAVVSGSAAFVVFAFQPALVMVPAQQKTPKVAPRVSGVAGQKAEKDQAAALAEKEQAEKFRMSVVSTAADAAMARLHHDDTESEPAARAKKRTQREGRKRSDGYATEARWSSNPVRLHGPE
jgi:hypothetical protein